MHNFRTLGLPLLEKEEKYNRERERQKKMPLILDTSFQLPPKVSRHSALTNLPSPGLVIFLCYLLCIIYATVLCLSCFSDKDISVTNSIHEKVRTHLSVSHYLLWLLLPSNAEIER